ncbi:MAG: hypothetical protein ACREMA_19425 [Longimicrobiales bacterium]
MITATALLVAFPFLPFLMPKRVPTFAGLSVMTMCLVSGLVFAWSS